MSEKEASKPGKETSEFLVVIVAMIVNAALVVVAQRLGIPVDEFREAIWGNSIGAIGYTAGRSIIKARAIV